MSDRNFQTIEHLKSGLSLSSRSGCPLGCAYCLLHAGSAEGRQVRILDTPEALVARLLQPQSLFRNGMTPLFLNNRTDPFLPQAAPDTLRMLELLAGNGVRSPVVLVSKFFPPEALRQFCGALPVMYVYSYSGLVGDFNFGDLDRIETATQVFPAERLYHYLRPVIPGRNDNPARLREILLRFADAGFSGSILSGIRVTAGNRDYLSEPLEAVSAHKLLSPHIYNRLLEDPALSRRGYPLFRHTSCAIDSFMRRANRLGYYARNGHCDSRCRNRVRCEAAAQVSGPALRAEISARFPDLEFTCGEEGVHIQSPVSQEVTAFLKNAYGIRVSADHLLLSPSEEVLTDGSASDRL